MAGVILVSENNEAQEMLKAVRRLLGKTRGIKTVALRPGQTTFRMQAALSRAIQQFDQREGILLLTDMYGSTQWNVCMGFSRKGAIEIVTGYNLPMLVKLGTLHDKIPLKKLIPFIEKYGREQIRRCCGKKRGK